MKKVITYNLKTGGQNSSVFYSDLDVFTNKVISKIHATLGGMIVDYRSFVAIKRLEPVRHEYEYMFDWLAFGVLWRHYSAAAVNTSPSVTALLGQLYSWRRRNKKVKPWLDPVRGVLATLFLVKSGLPHFSHIQPNRRHVKRFINYLNATGEFREEVKRFRIMDRFLLGLNEQEEFIIDLLELAGWFEDHAKSALGQYTPHVESFLQNHVKSHRWQEDYIFCSRKQVEYHLNMVGSELLNRAFRDDFIQSGKKAVLLPACMRSKTDGECQAKKMTLDSICTGCDANCRIHHYTKLGEQEGFEVHIIPHSSDFSAWLEHWAAGKNIGVVGVACLLNLMTGGLELKSLNIPAQCVFLDNCGCTNHWDKCGVQTDLDEAQLLKILETYPQKEELAKRACA